MKKSTLALLLLSLVGMGACLYLTHHHYQIFKQGFMGKSFCTLSSFVDCDVPLMSSYSKIGRMLTAEVGVLFYLFFGIISLWALFVPQARRPIFRFLFFPSLASLLYSAYFAYISIYVLASLCIFCAVTYGVNLGFLVVVLVGLKLNPLKAPSFVAGYVRDIFNKSRPAEDHPHFLRYFVGMILMGVVGFFFFQGLNKDIHARTPPFNKQMFLGKFFEQPVQEINLTRQPTKGNPQAKIHIIDFSDFQCPFCRRAAFSLMPYLGSYRNDVKITYVNYPLDMSCNPKIQRSMHGQACLAAKAALCAEKKGKFWEYHDLVFENQNKLSRKTLLRLAKKLDFSEEEFSQCLASDEIAARLAEDIEIAGQLDIQGTPALYLNGRHVGFWTHPKALPAIVEEELKRLK
ncbi:MAG: hypothetical protein A3I75_06160 [Deltaproteobacteria bacterium RIFCSPLOWO2_02_FULL_50_16]|nr:MAG: hypothetical protein A2053_00405 [Deltaproteobacteria bacterium GWA2_50_8]OGQ31453.1 MAG: hypothetical protein A3B79_06585 [Deltaproteobacteria bacterium RIFCSPHIGHO2_02_FULL_50_15]OGQ55978.1 MAG: hypothetical protein A3I75_06160 [Deltaproteobacteria bacterium RIFCSPLOWO2_02_FULL_50_16]OGQ66416.1 MAG: hypothetical protein A3F89_02635 [Deltaproteobacteria bacterium RIFCSPLOWO2_12_FULL_50_11]